EDSGRWIRVPVDHAGARVPGVFAAVAGVVVGVCGEAVFDGDAVAGLAGVDAAGEECVSLQVVGFEVFDVEAEGVGVAPELEGVAAGLFAGDEAGVAAAEVEDVAAGLGGGLVVAELDAGAGGDVVHVEGEAVVGEVAVVGGVPEIGAVQAA